jgi:hypothetical protein
MRTKTTRDIAAKDGSWGQFCMIGTLLYQQSDYKKVIGLVKKNKVN